MEKQKVTAALFCVLLVFTETAAKYLEPVVETLTMEKKCGKIGFFYRGGDL